MKKTILIIMGLIFSLSIMAQNERGFFDALKNQDMESAVKYFGREMNLCIGDFEEVVSSSSAKQKIGRFLNEHAPLSYSIKHQGNSKGGNSSYFVVDLQTASGPYRLFAYFDEEGKRNKITELRIEK
jgi:hypothetical protein